MTRRFAGARRQAEMAAARRDALAEMIAEEDISLSEAARRMGVSQQRITQMWKIIREGLGWQAV